MNTKGIRFRILLWCSLTLFLATALIFSSFYLVTRQILFQQVDKELTSHADKLVDIAVRQGIKIPASMLKQQLFNEFSEIPGMVVVLLDQDGNVIRSSLDSANPYLSYKLLFQKIQNTSSAVFLNLTISNTPMRFIAKPIKEEKNLLGIVLVAHPIEAIQKSLNSLLTTLWIIFALLMLPTILGGHILAAKIMYPVSHITNKMETITSEHLEERIDNPKSNDEIEKLVVTFNQLLDRLQESFQRERQFIGDVAHELKTPVASLRSGIELTLSKDRTSQEYKQAFDETLIDVNRLSTTIKNILDLAWLEADNANLGESHFDLSMTLQELKEIAVKLAAQKHLAIKGNIEPNIIISGTKDKIIRAIFNVIDNAIKYTPNNASVLISLHKKNEQAMVTIKDTGVGIPEKDLAHIFERFYRGSKTSKTLGSGLGLAISRGIIKAHRGDIQISSQVGKGTTVTISLPSVKVSS